MKPFNDIIAEHIDANDGEIDLPEIAKIAAEEMGDPVAPTVSEALQMLGEHLDYGLKFIGGLALQTAAEADALPAGFDDSYQSLLTSLEFDKLRRHYELKRQRTAKQIIVPGEQQ